MKKKKGTHKTWYKLEKFLTKHYGKDLYGEERVQEFLDNNNKKIGTIKFRPFNEVILHQRLVGYEVQEKVKKWVNKYCKEIKIISCDDAIYSSSIILLIPHPSHGITVLFIPQNTQIQNHFFLYDNHFKQLLDGLKSLSDIYGEKI